MTPFTPEQLRWTAAAFDKRAERALDRGEQAEFDRCVDRAIDLRLEANAIEDRQQMAAPRSRRDRYDHRQA